MNGVNRQVLIGNLAADAELARVGDKETPKLTFRAIVNTGFGDHEHTEGFNVVVWGKRAESLAPYLKKGQRVYAEGETRTHSWEGSDGQKRMRTEVVISPFRGDIVLLGNGARQPAPEDIADEEEAEE